MDADGYIRIVDRKKDMVVVSGFNVYPNEIEDCLATHPGVLEAAVIGVPDAATGEAVKAFIVARDKGLTQADIRAHCKEHLTAYKVPEDRGIPRRPAEIERGQDPAEGPARGGAGAAGGGVAGMVGAFEQALLALMIFVIMLGMGASLTPRDFWLALKRPYGLMIGVVSQYGFMPLIGFLLITILPLPSAIAVGV
jgi:hypothetical protein